MRRDDHPTLAIPLDPVDPAVLLRRDDSLPSVDVTVFSELLTLADDVDPGFLERLLREFTSDSETLLAELHQALLRGDALEVGRLAHRLKGSSAQLGGLRLAASCGFLELGATRNDLSTGQPVLRVIEADYKEMCDAMTDLIANRSPLRDAG